VTADRPNLLVALSRYPGALQTGSAILIHHNLVSLSERYALHLVCRGAGAPTGDLADACRVVEFAGRDRSWVPRPLRAPLRALAGPPPAIAGLRSERVRSRVAALMDTGRYGALLVYDLGSVQYVPPGHAARTVACIEDPQALRLARMAELPVWTAWQRLRLRRAARRMRRYERRLLPPLARVLLLSEADARDMASVEGHRNLGVASYPGATPARNDAEPGRVDGRIVFSGNMDHPANVDGALWLLHAIFPRVLEKHPAATLRIVGARPDPRLHAAAGRFGERVAITGRVPDVSEEVRRARVSACPVRLAIGVQTKVVEALSLGTPVVSTSAGNRGVAAVAGETIWVEDDPDAFSGRVAGLLRGEGWDRLSRQGRLLASERFTPAHSADQLARHLEAVRGGGPPLWDNPAPH
jgi:glycosyltransferase involved in cell wall biosynthesis